MRPHMIQKAIQQRMRLPAAHCLQIFVNAFRPIGPQQRQLQFVRILHARRPRLLYHETLLREKPRTLFYRVHHFGPALSESVIGVKRNPHSLPCARLKQFHRRRAEIGIVFTRQKLHGQNQIFREARHWPHLPQRFNPPSGGRHMPGARQPSAGGLDARNAAERRRQTYTARGVAAQPQR